MNKTTYPIFLLALLFIIPGTALSHQDCEINSLGKPVCAPPMGGITKDKYGQPVCGMGQCLANNLGNIVCSAQKGGYSTIDLRGQTVCTGGCIPASASSCQTPKN
jgi:hypothetical protein